MLHNYCICLTNIIYDLGTRYQYKQHMSKFHNNYLFIIILLL